MSERVEYISKNVNFYPNERFLPQIELNNCGKVVLREWMVPMRSLPLWHVYLNSAPGGSLILPEKTIEMRPDTVYLLPSYLTFATASTGIFEHVYLDFYLQNDRFSRVRKDVITCPAEECRPLLERCFRDGFSPLAAGSLILYLLDGIGSEHLIEEGAFPIDPRIQRALELISAAFRNGRTAGLDNRSISRKIGMSEVNFLHLFKRELKLPPHRYILNRRLELAHDLLRSTGQSIEDIAESAGFSNRYQFSNPSPGCSASRRDASVGNVRNRTPDRGSQPFFAE